MDERPQRVNMHEISPVSEDSQVNRVLARFNAQHRERAVNLSLPITKGNAEELSTLTQTVVQLADLLAQAKTTISDKDELIATLSRQLGHSVDEWAKLEAQLVERGEQILALENAVSRLSGQYPDAAREPGGLEMKAQRSRDVQMASLFFRVAKLGESENDEVQRAISETKAFLNGDACPSEKSVRAYETLDFILRRYAMESHEYAARAKRWMTESLDEAKAKMAVLKRSPEALEQIQGYTRDYWPKAECHASELCQSREQIALQARLTKRAFIAALVALREGSGTKVVYACVKTACTAQTVMRELHDAACHASVELDGALSRTAFGLQSIFDVNKRDINQGSANDLDASKGTRYGSSRTSTTAVYPQAAAGYYSANESAEYSTGHNNSPGINIANGLPMNGAFDTAGNPFGFDDTF